MYSDSMDKLEEAPTDMVANPRKEDADLYNQYSVESPEGANSFDTDENSLAARDSLALAPSGSGSELRDPSAENGRRRRKKILACLLVLFIAVLAIVLSITLTKNSGSNEDRGAVSSEADNPAPISPAPTQTPTVSPAPTTPAPTSSLELTDAYKILAPKVSNPKSLVNSTTPQGKAFLTILNESDEFFLVQRFALMTVWYATGGGEWTWNFGWRDYAAGTYIPQNEECNWPGVSLCRNQGNGASAVSGFTLGTCDAYVL